MAKTQVNTEPEILDGQIDAASEIPEWATADPIDQQVATTDGTYAEQYRRHLAPDELIVYVASQISKYEDDDPRMALEIAAQVAAASNLDEVLDGVDTTKGKEILDTILNVNGIKFVMSTEPGGCPYFGLISAVDTATREPHVISVGGWRLVLQLGQIHYITSHLEPGSKFLVPKDSDKAIAPESFPLFFRVKSKPTNTPGRSINYLARVTD